MKNYVSFNEVDLPSFVRVTGRTSSVLPSVNVISQSVIRMHGEYFNRIEMDARVEKLDIVIIQDSEFDLYQKQEQLAIWLMGNAFKESKLKFMDQPEYYLMGTVDGNTDISDLFVAGEGSITFKCAKPIKYYNKETVLSGTGSITENYTGTAEQRGVFEIKVSTDCSKVVLGNSRESNKVTLNANFKAGDILVVDCNKKLIKLNGKVDMSILNFKSNWTSIFYGKNTLTVTDDKGVGLVFTVTYRKISY